MTRSHKRTSISTTSSPPKRANTGTSTSSTSSTSSASSASSSSETSSASSGAVVVATSPAPVQGLLPAALPHHTSVKAGVQATGNGRGGFTTGMARGLPFEVVAKTSTVDPDMYGVHKLVLRVSERAIASAAPALKEACRADLKSFRDHVKEALAYVTAEASKQGTPDLTKRKVFFDDSSGELTLARRHDWDGAPRVFTTAGGTYADVTDVTSQLVAGTVIQVGVKISSYINVGEGAYWGVSGRFHNDIVVLYVPPVPAVVPATLEAPPSFNF